MDAKCRQLTASWQREKAKTDDSVELCELFEGHEMAGSEALLPAGEVRMPHSTEGHDVRFTPNRPFRVVECRRASSVC